MEIEIKDIDESTLEELFPPCNSCLYWEAPDKFDNEKGKSTVPEDEAIQIKQDWFKRTSGAFGNVGKLLYVDGKATGYAQYAPSHLLDNVGEYSRELFPPGSDAILLSCIYIRPEYQGKGLGTRFLQAVLEDLKGRGYQAVETYSTDGSTNNASGPTELYLENGFKVVKAKNWGGMTFSLVRLELSSEQ